MQAMLKQTYGEDGYAYEKGAAPVTVVSFAAPNVGDAEWAANFDRKINARNIVFQGDFVPRVGFIAVFTMSCSLALWGSCAHSPHS